MESDTNDSRWDVADQRFDEAKWHGVSSDIGRHIESLAQQSLAAYSAQPLLVEEHANFERATAQGGYGRRQITELVQNGADAMLKTPGGRIEVVLSETALYCANQGAPISEQGVDAILGAYLSVKRGVEIGRFGLGFKSVLGVSNQPEVYSRSGSFGFNAELSAARIYDAVPSLRGNRTPALRLAVPLDPVSAAFEDPILHGLMGWADTVIKLPRLKGAATWLDEDLQEFPPEFLLFSPHVGKLLLRHLESGLTREVDVRQEDGTVRLRADGTEEQWRVFQANHAPSPQARQEAGELADRDELPILWAVPLAGRQTRGKFWAFFPTEYETTLSGILNAPWKLNEDRKNLLRGTFNSEMLQRASQLVVDNLTQLVTPADPGAILDVLPARGREAANWADSVVTETVYELARDRACIPDADGELRKPEDLQLQPSDLPAAALAVWNEFPSRPSNWCHLSIESATRRSRVERLFASIGRGAATTVEWLEVLAQDGSPAASAASLRAAAVMIEQDTAWKLPVEQARILLDSEGEIVPPQGGTVFMPRDASDLGGKLKLVDSGLLGIDGVRDALAVLGISEIDPSSELEDLVVRRDERRFTEIDWEHFWKLVRKIDIDRAESLIRTKVQGDLQVRTLTGTFASLKSALLPGAVVPSDGSRDAAVAIDTRFHRDELELLQRFGAVSGPTAGQGSTDENWFAEYRQWAVDAYMSNLMPGARRPAANYLNFSPRRTVGPLAPIFSLSDEGRARFTDAVLIAAAVENPWNLEHDTLSRDFPARTFPPPADWIVQLAGRLDTSLGYRLPGDAVAPMLSEWRDVLPVARCSADVAVRLKLATSIEALSASQRSAALTAADAVTDDKLLGRLYAALCEVDRDAPATLRCRVGASHQSMPTCDVTVVSESADLDALALTGKPGVLVPGKREASILCDRWGLIATERSVTTTIEAEESGPRVRLVDQFPTLDHHLRDKPPLTLVPCSSLRLEVLTPSGKHGEERDCLELGGTFFYNDALSHSELLERVTDRLGIDLTPDERAEALDYRRMLEQRLRVTRIRKLGALSEKLLEAVGEEALKRRLPAGLIKSVEERLERPLEAAEVADATLAVYGVETLHEFRQELQESGLEPPQSWAGSSNARAFAETLGFAPEFGGFESARREAVLNIDGPPQLPELHAFQAQSAEKIRRLTAAPEPRRGLLSLPTGAGKTRVCTEALTRCLADGEVSSPILWIAQTDELCEQAVQTWSEVWRAFGPRRRLRISRLWAANGATPIDGSHVVVATIAKLQGCVTDPSYRWLSAAACVVVDEAHAAVGPSYTRVLEWLGLGRSRSKDRCPLIGLTATPFRGDEDETKRLVQRFGGLRLDDVEALGADAYVTLQKMGVLSKVDHHLLSGSELKLTEAELNELETLKRLPSSVAERVALDTSRNDMLLRSIASLPKEWPVLLFGVSVEHAQTMAALLRLEGLSAAAIWGAMESGARRYYVEQFRGGRVQVLTNYGVLTAGFDAPQVRAIYVARPTYSASLYQQMIGRGLRGPLNGGKDVCLIVNVEDNIISYGGTLAFTQFEYLWRDNTDAPGVST